MNGERFAIINFHTAGYNRYFRPFYESIRRHFFPGWPKTFFIFTDNPYIEEDDIEVVKIPPTGISYHSCFAHQFCFAQMVAISSWLAEFDHIVFFNGNALVIQNIGPEYHPEDNKHKNVYAPRT